MISYQRFQGNEFYITDNHGELNVPYIHRYLCDHSYWAAGIPIETVYRCIEGSICFGVFEKNNNNQIGFARVITDKASFGYLADVFIDESYRGLGLSTWLMSVILKHPGLQGLRRIMLGTRDAHSLYRKFGFTDLKNPERFMEIHNPDVYKKKDG
jgi:GNAT superfamily N-acetyltransferase